VSSFLEERLYPSWKLTHPPGIPDQFGTQESYIAVDCCPSLYSALLASFEDVQSENTPLLNRTRVRRLLYISIKGKRNDTYRQTKKERIT
jgi:hypothetical protein